MNGSKETGGTQKAATTSKSTNNQPTLSVRAKMVRYGRHTTFGTVGDNDEDFRTIYNTSAGNISTPDEDNSVRQPQRPLPPSKPPPPLPRTRIMTLNDQPIPPVRVKTLRYGRHTTFGTVGDNDEDFRTIYNTSAGNMSTPDEDDSVRQPERPLPPPGPPPSLPRTRTMTLNDQPMPPDRAKRSPTPEFQQRQVRTSPPRRRRRRSRGRGVRRPKEK